jgi:hypothetical protein
MTKEYNDNDIDDYPVTSDVLSNTSDNDRSLRRWEL